MRFPIAIKSVAASVLQALGLISFRLRRYSRVGSVCLMYHRIIPKWDVEREIQEGMYVELEVFESHLRFLKRKFEIVPISEVASKPKKRLEGLKGRSFCILTFDDGWYDFYEHVFPLLKAHQVPATVFLPTDFIGTEKWFWTDELGFLFGGIKDLKNLIKRSRLSGNELARKLLFLRGSKENQLEEAIQILKSYRDNEIEDLLTEIATESKLDLDPPGRAFLTWEEVRDMARSGLISYGSHTASHRILRTLTDGEIHDDLMKSKNRLIDEKVVNPPFIPFSYPNGNYDERIVRIVKEAGYSLAVTTKSGWNDPGSNSFNLRRIAIHQDMSSTEAMFACRIANIF